jgi:hypothetical protein
LEDRDLVVVEFESREIGDMADIDVVLLHGLGFSDSDVFSKFQVRREIQARSVPPLL